jgi:hypothetical protein
VGVDSSGHDCAISDAHSVMYLIPFLHCNRGQPEHKMSEQSGDLRELGLRGGVQPRRIEMVSCTVGSGTKTD